MATNYVILKSTPAPAAGFRAGVRTTGTTRRGAGAAPRVTFDVDTLTPSKAAEVARKRGVDSVAPVVPIKLIEPVSRDAKAEATTATGSTWGVKAVGAETSKFTGEGAVVAVLDTGIDPKHEAFTGIELVRQNFTNEADDDQHGHGTHCAGTIAGRKIGGTFRIGVAPGIKKLLIGKVLGDGGGGSDTLVAAIQWAVQSGANVVSMSLGIDFPGLVAQLIADGLPAQLATSRALEQYRANVQLFERLAALIRSQGDFGQACVIVAAAGNESQLDVNPEFSIAVSPPAVSEGIISVAAVARGDKGFTVAPFSNFGARVAGPGVGVLSAKPGGGMVAMDGTSMATPHVAGVAALWVQKLSNANQLRGQLLIDRLAGSGTTTGFAPNFDPVAVGAGMVQAPQR
jgi:subtilisin family serine protease